MGPRCPSGLFALAGPAVLLCKFHANMDYRAMRFCVTVCAQVCFVLASEPCEIRIGARKYRPWPHGIVGQIRFVAF